MINIIKEHLDRYPRMQIQDAAKLLYQNEFGGGHMIANPERSLLRLHKEHASLTTEMKHQTPYMESIGSQMYRIYLSTLSYGLSEETLNKIFVQSANHKKGKLSSFEEKLGIFLNACKTGVLPFPATEVSKFIKDWKEKGYPVISHSSVYREAYSPAYRVIEERYAHIISLIMEIFRHVSSNKDHPYIIAIDGMSASGKSTLAKLLHENFPESNLFHMDDYFLQPYQRTAERLEEIGGNVDYERFQSEILSHLSDRNGLTYRKYDCCTQTLGNEIFVPWKPLVIVEGSYSHHPYFHHPYNLRIFCEITPDEQRNRILERNGEFMLNRFISEWIPKENLYFQKYQIKEKVDSLL